MNHDTLSRRIALLGKKVPKEWRSKLMETSKPFEEQKYRLERILNTGKLKGKRVPLENQRKIASVLERGGLDKNVETINRGVEDKVDEALTEIVRDEIRSGNLPDPRKVVERDPFIREQTYKWSKIKK